MDYKFWGEDSRGGERGQRAGLAHYYGDINSRGGIQFGTRLHHHLQLSDAHVLLRDAATLGSSERRVVPIEGHVIPRLTVCIPRPARSPRGRRATGPVQIPRAPGQGALSTVCLNVT